jgi:nucleoside-diphosphate-sugar epimerase
MKFSIYGSSGFIGSRFCEMFSNYIKIPRENSEPQSEHCLYFISTTHNYNIFDKPYEDINTNLKKLIEVLESCRKKNNTNTVFNFISSWFVYGMNCSLDTKETDHCDPTGFYSITKRAAEQMLICYCNTYNIKYRILRLTNIIGEGDLGISLKKNALQYMINLLKNNDTVKLYETGSNIRDFMHVDDACRAIEICINNAPFNEIINISNKQPTTIGKLIHYSKEKLQSKSNIISIDSPIFHKVVQVKNVCLNNNKLLSCGYTPSINTIEAVDRILYNIQKD